MVVHSLRPTVEADGNACSSMGTSTDRTSVSAYERGATHPSPPADMTIVCDLHLETHLEEKSV